MDELDLRIEGPRIADFDCVTILGFEEHQPKVLRKFSQSFIDFTQFRPP
jgi:hypothetical protein